MAIILTFTAAQFYNANKAHAAEFEIRKNSIRLSGEIIAGDEIDFLRALDNHGNQLIETVGPGGNLSAALKIGEIIRERGLATHLPSYETCASACVIIFAGGLIRTAGHQSKFGIHMASGVFNEQFVNAAEEAIIDLGSSAVPVIVSLFEAAATELTLKQVTFYLKSGISLQLLEKTSQVHHLDIYWLSKEEAHMFNLVNTVDN